MTPALRVFAALGPGDIVIACKAQIAGDPMNETSITFSEQLLAYVRYRKIQTLAISSNARTDKFEDDVVVLENRPRILRDCGGSLFHISIICYGLYLAFRAKRFGADIAIIDSGTTHYFVLTAFRLLGIQVTVNLHNVLWPAGYPPKTLVSRLIRILNRLFFRFVAAGAIGVSPECERQIQGESRNKIPFYQYRCQFRLDGFRSSQPYTSGIFRIVFAGRAEENKGLLDLAKIAAALKTHAQIHVAFEICGSGPAIPELKRLIEKYQLSDRITVHGRLERNALLAVYASSHAMIVPTRSNFTEGMPQVCAEAVLAGLPIITSQLSNAFDVLGPAIIRAEPDDVESYSNAILRLIEDSDLRTHSIAMTSELALQFSDRAMSYPAALDRLLSKQYQFVTLATYDQLFGKKNCEAKVAR